MPTVLFHPVFGAESATDNGGDKMHSPGIFLIFNAPDQTWGDVATQQPSAAASAIINATTNLCNSAYFSGLLQYGSDGQASVAGFRLDNTPLVPGQFTEDDIDDLIDNQVDNFIPDDSNNLYVVITAPGAVAANGDVGFHFSSDLVEAWVTPSDKLVLGSQAFVDRVTQILSHEIAESMSDPWGDGIQVTPGALWTGGGGDEISDQEAKFYLCRVNGTLAQAYWSETDQAYLFPDGGTQVFDVTGGVLTVNGDQIFLPTNDNITVDASATGDVMVTLNTETVTFGPGQIGSIVINPGGSFSGFNKITVAATNVPVTINSTAVGGDEIKIGKNSSIQGIQAKVTVNNISPYTSLTIDDAKDPAWRAITASASDIQFDSSGPNIHLNGEVLDTSLYAGGPGTTDSSSFSGGNVINVTSLAGHPLPTNPQEKRYAGTLHIYAGFGDDTVTVGHNLDDCKGWLTVTGQGHTAVLIKDDKALGGHSYTVYGETFSRSGMPHYFVLTGLRDLEVIGSQGPNTFNVSMVPFNTTVTVIGGPSGQNRLIAGNGANDWSLTGDSSGALMSKGCGLTYFWQIQNLQGGTNADDFQFLQGLSKEQTITGGGGSDWLDYSAFDSAHSATVNLGMGTATGVVGSVAGIRNVIGGPGFDFLTGGPGGNILIGGGGNDTLVGGANGNLLIGGLGADTLTGGAAGDILIGDYTDYDIHAYWHRAALQSILDQWRTDTSLFRIARLMSFGFYTPGLNGGNFLNQNTVHNDAALDTLNLAPGGAVDWYFRHLGFSPDVVNGAAMNDVPFTNY